jgi:hypothetical protein
MRSMRGQRLCVLLLFAAAVCLGPLASAQVDGPAHTETDDLTLADIQNLSFKELRELGQAVFTTPFNTHDGLGDGPYDPGEWPPFEFGHRPGLQTDDTHFLRINGLDAQSCNECHVIVSHATRPPTLGIAGVGGIVQQAIILPTMLDVSDSFDDRMGYLAGHTPDLPMVPDGVADYNGRFANPPFLFGAGGVELLAKEMTADLQAILAQALVATPGTVLQLTSKGVDFGSVTNVGFQAVELDLEGIGPIEVDEDNPAANLVVTPFGRKGENFSVRDFDRGAMQFHFGIQPVEVFGAGTDEDGDGHVDEVTEAEMSALHFFGVTNPPPEQGKTNPAAQHGEALFASIGCTYCHRPSLTTSSQLLPLAHPEDPTDPSANVYGHVDLKKVGFKKSGPGVVVPLFSDLKRHDMGPRLAESFEIPGKAVADEMFVTARLWGIADTAPYMHDGRATTLFEAIEMHGGEAQAQRDNFLALGASDQSDLIAFLNTLRVPGMK